MPTLSYGFEAWSLRREDLFKRLRRFYHKFAHCMCRVNLHHATRYHITYFRRMASLNWPRRAYAHELCATAVAN